MISVSTIPVALRTLLLVLPALLLIEGASAELHAQTILKRKVIAGGGGTSSSSGHTMRGTLSQTAAGRLTHGGTDRHNVGFWYWAYRPEIVTRVSIPQLQAEVGTRITVPVNLTIAEADRPFLPRSFRARIRFNRTLLHRGGSTTPDCAPNEEDCVMEISGIAAEEGVIAELELITALGNAESTELTIEQFEWDTKGEARIATVREHGELKLLDVCREGDQIRLIRSGPLASRLRIWPNPASERATLEFVAAESGPIEVRLVDLYGNTVAKLAETEAEAERLYQSEIDLGEIPSGSYIVIYSTPTQMLTRHLLITQ